MGDPSSTGVNPVNERDEESIYYDRNSGQCYIYDSSDWRVKTSSDTMNISNSLNPPLVQVDKFLYVLNNICQYSFDQHVHNTLV